MQWLIKKLKEAWYGPQSTESEQFYCHYVFDEDGNIESVITVTES